MNEVYDFIDFRNQTRATIEKLLRIARSEYLHRCQSSEKAGKKQSAKAEWKRQKHQLYHYK